MPHDVLDRALDLLRTKEMDAFVALFAEDAVFELPFLDGSGPRRFTGRETLRRYLDGYPEPMDIHGFPHVLVHDTTSPGTVVVEFTAEGTTVRTGSPYEMRYIAVMTVRDGLITGYRDYWSPIMAARAGGSLPELVEALRAEVGA